MGRTTSTVGLVALLCAAAGPGLAGTVAERFDEARLELRLEHKSARSVAVAGDWNEWCGSLHGRLDPKVGAMRPSGAGRFAYPLEGRVAPGRHEYKFIIDGVWEGGGNRVLTVDRAGRLMDPYGLVAEARLLEPARVRVAFARPVDTAAARFELHPPHLVRSVVWSHAATGAELVLAEPLPLQRPVALVVDGVPGGPIERELLPDPVLHQVAGTAERLGIFEERPGSWRFRVFAPRATSVTALLRPLDGTGPERWVSLEREAGGTWTALEGADVRGFGTVYRITGEGHDFASPRDVVDPYAVAVASHHGPAVVREPPPARAEAAFRPPRREDLVICELHVRDYTAHPSSGVRPELRGKFLGLAEGARLDWLVRMGFNAVELLPVAEFDEEPAGSYHWGYMSSQFMAPESSYATRPDGRQVEEFAALVRACHARGLAVLLDVVFNHTGAPHHLAALDRAYYYRRSADGTWRNVSGCGNDLRSESPMARRLIVDSVRYWLERFGVDGLRFDLAHLLDLDTLREVARVAEEVRPGAVLIAEPWSFGGNYKSELGRMPAWSAWNDDFRNRVKDFVLGRSTAEELQPVLAGSTKLWAGTPCSSVNYVESHDDMTLVDHLSSRHDHDGSHPTLQEIRRNRMCSLMLLTAPGIPMLAEGQELLRSKGGCPNSYDKGDTVNAVRWDRARACAANVDYVQALIHLRRSPAGRPFRRSDPVPGGRWPTVAPSGGRAEHAVGLVIGGPPDYLLLLNGSESRGASFALPAGRWRQVADLDRVQAAGPTVATWLSLRPLDGRLLVRMD